MDVVVQHARRRMVALLVLEESCRAAAAVFGLLALMLLAGASVFHPAWPATAVVLAAAWVLWRVRRRMPDDYAVAQRADAGLGMKDLLATAWHLRHCGNPQRSALAPLIDERAEAACGGADARRAVPLRWSRPAALAAAAFAAALGVFLLRVGVLRTFDLRPPLVAVHFDTLTGAPVPPAPPGKPPLKKLDLPGLTLEEGAPGAHDEEQLPMEALRSVEGREAAAQPSQAGRKTGGRTLPQGESLEESGQDAEGGADEPREGGEDSGASDSKENSPRQPGDSLLDKMRDALASLMEKFKLETPPGDGSRTSAQNGKKEAARREQGRPQPGRKGEQGEEGERMAGQQQAAADAAQQGKAEQGGRPDAPSQNEKSGIGKEEGRKELEAAEELQALGKLDELLGKRALNVQGEVMVEVTNSKNQQLRTPYADRMGPRTDAGSELGRDEVPLHLQQYVQRYYEQVRRTAPAPAKPQ